MNSRSYLIVGHGGQGVLDLGNFIAYDAILHGLHAAYTPSYGPETRGGKVKCFVVKSPEEIDSPITDKADVLLAMNNPSMDLESSVIENGSLLMNSSLIDRSPTRSDIEVASIPLTEIADRLKDQVQDIPDTKVLQNSVAYGALQAIEKETLDSAVTRAVLEHVYLGTKARFVPANLTAVKGGYDWVQERGLRGKVLCG